MIAIIGNPNVGKTTLLNKLRKNGYSTFETDAWILSQYNDKNSEAYKSLVEEFGVGITSNNKIDKNELKKLIKCDFLNLKKIEEKIHPLVLEHLTTNKYDFVEIPILKWSTINFTNLFSKVINLQENPNEKKSPNVDNFSDTLIDANKRDFRRLMTVDIYAKNTQNIETFLKKIKFLSLVKL